MIDLSRNQQWLELERNQNRTSTTGRSFLPCYHKEFVNTNLSTFCAWLVSMCAEGLLMCSIGIHRGIIMIAVYFWGRDLEMCLRAWHCSHSGIHPRSSGKEINSACRDLQIIFKFANFRCDGNISNFAIELARLKLQTTTSGRTDHRR